jgi:WD40 repeat protein
VIQAALVTARRMRTKTVLASVRLFAIGLLCIALMAVAQTPPGQPPELVLQAGHSQPIYQVAFSHDQRWLASASSDHTLKLWDLSSGLEVRTFTGHTDEVTAVEFSPDGRLLASAGDDNNVKLWDVASGRELFTLSTGNHPMGVMKVAFDSTGQKLVSLNQDRTVITWDVVTGQRLSEFSAGGASGIMYGTDLTPDAHYVLSEVSDHTIGRDSIQMWDAGAGQLLSSHLINLNINHPVISSGARWMASTDDHYAVNVWDIAKGQQVFILPGSPNVTGETGFSLAFSPDERLLAVGDTQKHVLRLLDAATGNAVQTFQNAFFYGLQFSDDGRRLATVDGRNIDILDVGTGRVLQSLHGYTQNIGALTMSADGHFLSAQNRDDNGVSVWDLKSGGQVKSIPGGDTNVGAAAVALSADGRILAASFSSPDPPYRIIKVLDVGSGKIVNSFTGLGYVTSTAISPDGSLLAAGDFRGGMEVWDLRSSQVLVSREGEVNTPSCHVAFSPDRNLLAVTGQNSVVVWDTAKHDWVGSLPAGWVLALAFSSDGKRLASADLNTHAISVWNLESNVPMLSIGNQPKINALAFSPDGRWLASAGVDNLVRLWDLATGNEVREFSGHGGEVTGVVFTPDVHWLISSGAEGSIRIWNPSTGENAAILSSISGTDDWVAITPNGLFDGTPKGTKQLVTWRVGNRVLAASQFYDAYSSPGLLAHVLAGNLSENPITPKPLFAGFKLPPSVHLAPFPGGNIVNDPQVKVAVEAVDEGGGISEVRLYQNGKLAGARLASPGPRVQYTFEVSLIPGQENVLRAVALGGDRVESSPDEINLHYEAPAPPKPTLHLLVVGINDYDDRSLHLDFAQPDAQALARFFPSHGDLFSSVNVISLFDKDATKANIQAAFDRLAQSSNPEDVALFYFAGHGMLVGREFYFLPHDMRKDADIESAVQKYGISASAFGEALQHIKAVKQVLILDACQSESALPALAKATFGIRGIEKPEERAVRMLAHANGIYLIAASTAEQYAYEVPALGHGVFTYALLSGLGEHDQPQAATAEGIVTVLSLINYVARAVPELTEKYHMSDPQTPVIFDAGTDIPLIATASSIHR